MNEEAKKFRSKYFYAARRTTLPYDQNEVIKSKFEKAHEKAKKLESKKDIEK